MNTADTNDLLPLVFCPHCDAIKQDKRCKGMCAALMTTDGPIYLEQPITRYFLLSQQATRIAYTIEIIGSVISSILLFVLFLVLTYQEYGAFDVLMTTTFWTSGAQGLPLLLFFSLTSLGYVLYRSRAMAQVQQSLPMQTYSLSANIEASQSWYIPATWEEIVAQYKQGKNIYRLYTPAARQTVKLMYDAAQERQSGTVTCLDVFRALLKDEQIRSVFLRLKITSKLIDRAIVEAQEPDPKTTNLPQLAPEVRNILFYAYHYASEAGMQTIGTPALLSALYNQSPQIQEYLYDLDITKNMLDNVIEWVRMKERMRQRRARFFQAASHRNKYGIDKAMTAVATPFLNSLSFDMTVAAIRGHNRPIVARDQEIDDVFRVVDSGAASFVLVGERGVGKKSIIEGIVERIVIDQVPNALLEKRVVQLSTSALLAGTTVQGAQQRFIQLMTEVARARNIVLCIENVQDLIGSGEGLDISETIAEYVRDYGVLLIATTTPQAYRQVIANSQLGSIMTKVDVAPMTQEQTIRVLEATAGSVEYKHHVFFAYQALQQTVQLADKFLFDQYLPESAIGLLAEAASYTKHTKGEHSLVEAASVAAVINKKTGIPTAAIETDESKKLLELESVMHEQVIGQEEAVVQVANALRRARANIRSTKRPIANFLFLGPTGVGKTELAKTIAGVYFGGEQRMIRIDMSEFQDVSSIYRLIGEPNKQGTGLLTEAVRQQPFSLILLDEMEKAHPQILDLFLQVFDDGRLTDSVGRVIDFTNAIVIATSNAGTRYVQEQMNAGVPLETIRNALINTELQTQFRPEFLNRFDGIVLFRSLNQDEIRKIAQLMLRRIEKEIEARGMKLEVTKEALDILVQAGFDPAFGARPMRRAIQDIVENPLAQLLIAGTAKRRDTIVVDETGVHVA